MLADEHPDSSLRHVGIGGEERLLLQVKVEVLKEIWRLQGNVEEGHLSGVGGGGRVTSRQDLATDLDVDVTSRSKYIEEPDYATSYLEAWQARTVRESKTEQRTASLEKETVLAS